jgi:lysophospholipid acyltransferase
LPGVRDPSRLPPSVLIYAIDGRRYVRPLFLTPEGQPTPQKIYYDAFTCIITQLVFSFTSVPFIVLTVRDTLTIWSRVYMFGVLGVAASYAAFSTPAVRTLLARSAPAQPAKDGAAPATRPEKPAAGDDDGDALKPQRPVIVRNKSSVADDVMFGLPVDAEHELLELRDFMADVRAEIVRRKEAGMAIPDVREMVRQKLVEAGVPMQGAPAAVGKEEGHATAVQH